MDCLPDWQLEKCGVFRLVSTVVCTRRLAVDLGRGMGTPAQLLLLLATITVVTGVVLVVVVMRGIRRR